MFDVRWIPGVSRCLTGVTGGMSFFNSRGDLESRRRPHTLMSPSESMMIRNLDKECPLDRVFPLEWFCSTSG